MSTTLLDLSDELLAHICSYAMISLAADDNINNNNNNNNGDNASSSPQTSKPTTPSNPRTKFPTPINGVITEQISKRLRHLLQPFRCCHRLYKIAKYQFLESNVIVLNLSDIRGSASRLEFTSGTTQMIMTGNPDPLLRNLVHVQLVVSISDMRTPFTRPFASSSSSSGGGGSQGLTGLWRRGGGGRDDILSLNQETENLRRLNNLCPALRTCHLFLKVDEWILYGRGPELKSLKGEVALGDIAKRYRRLAEALIEILMQEVLLRIVTVSFSSWRGDAEVLRLEEEVDEVDVEVEGGRRRRRRRRRADEILDACLMNSIQATLTGPIARVR